MDYLINYANQKYKRVQKINSWTGKHIAKFDKVYSFGPNDIDDDFRITHSNILSYERGNGLWLWKPYFINKVISECQDGDYVFYLDSGAFFIRDPHVLISYIDDCKPLFVTDIPLIESCWTKPSCFEALNANEYADTNQIQAAIVLFKVNGFTRDFFREHLDLCANTDLLIPEGLGKFDRIDRNYGNGFVSHREDQSVFSLLCKKKGIKAHRDITQRGLDPMSFYNPNYAYRVPEHPDDYYKTIVFIHKSPTLGPVFWLRYLKNKTLR